MLSEDIVIRVQAVTKRYFLYARPEDRLKQSIVPRLQRLIGQPQTKYYRDFTAINEISFEVKRGETVGIIGRNGSGKSTLLQIMCGTLQPTSGTVEVQGRVAALLELGAGFNADYTGRENVYLCATILGLSRSEIERRFAAIAAFADIGAFIDQPVKTYSSGMYVRLAFATAINLDPEILVLDETLAVGDEAFQRKCYARIEDIQARGGTIVLVSHAPQTVVQLCARALLIDGGELLLEGPPKLVIGHYQRLLNASAETTPDVRARIRRLQSKETAAAFATPLVPSEIGPNAAPTEWLDLALASQSAVSYENAGARISDVRIADTGGRTVNVLRSGNDYVLSYRVEFERDAQEVAFGFLFRTTAGLDLAGVGTSLTRRHRLGQVRRGDVAVASFRFKCSLLPGTYFVTAGASAVLEGERRFLHRVLDAMPFRVIAEDAGIAVGYFDLDVRPDIVLHEAMPAEALQ